MELTGEALEKALKQKKCSADLVDWVLERGDLMQQASFLFAQERSPETMARFRTSRHPAIVSEVAIHDESSYLAWASDLGFELPAEQELGDDGEELGIRWHIDNWNESKVDDMWSRHDALTKDNTDSVQVGVIKALGHLINEYHKNGMQNWGNGNLAVYAELIRSTLTEDSGLSPYVKKVVDADICTIVEDGRRAVASDDKDVSAERKLLRKYLKYTEPEVAHSRLSAAIDAWATRPNASTPV